MKKIILLLCLLQAGLFALAQNFKTDITNARTNYATGKLGEAHFNLQQAMQELDIIVGKEVLKILPASMDTLASNPKSDNVSSAAGFIGTTIHRLYGHNGKTADVEIITNSPVIASLNTFLNMPGFGGFTNNENSKSISVQGYKGRLDKSTGATGQTDFTLQIPIASTLITFKVTNSTDTETLNLFNTIPLQQVAGLLK